MAGVLKLDSLLIWAPFALGSPCLGCLPSCSSSCPLGSRVSWLTKETPSFKDELDVLKFLCKDLWITVFKKQVDNLRTNHQGTYMLQDNQFLLLSQLSNGKQYLEEAPKFLAFTCGLVKGALSNLGFDSTVTAEVPLMPSSKFQVVIQKS
ncbi:CD9 antigen [Platysternon megacephalum]|uniref:CD9 antigen n=1 Tax=Platysternon megacephalum TaxID=55544 RepID=A0A4D9DT04_9SAUR|nr:CD9 antigen [Platysternon megacephalum]